MEKLETIVEEIRSEFEAKSAVRDTALQRSRTLIRYCANAIRAAHRADWAEGEELLNTARLAARELIADLEQLKPPESVAGEWDRYLDALDDVSTSMAEAGAAMGAALSGGKPDMEELGRLDAGAEDMSEAAVSYDEAVQDLNRAGVMSKCFSVAISDFEVGQKEPGPTSSGQQSAEPNPQGPK